jgi:hypothetical protein
LSEERIEDREVAVGRGLGFVIWTIFGSAFFRDRPLKRSASENRFYFQM